MHKKISLSHLAHLLGCILKAGHCFLGNHGELISFFGVLSTDSQGPSVESIAEFDSRLGTSDLSESHFLNRFSLHCTNNRMYSFRTHTVGQERKRKLRGQGKGKALLTREPG